MILRARELLYGNPAFRRLWLATATAELGAYVGRMAFILLVHELAREEGRDPAGDVGLLLFLETLPMLLLGPFAGALVDRFDRRRLLILCNLAVGGLLCAIPALTLLPVRWPLFAIAVVFSSIGTIYQPARQSVLPDVVAPGDLTAANALSTLTTSLALVLGTALSGVLIALVGKNGCFYVDAAGYPVSIAFLWRLSLPRHSTGARHVVDLARSVMSGLRFLFGEAVLVFLSVVFFLTYAMIGAWYPVLPAFVEGTLGRDPDRWVPLTLASFSVGGVIGGISAPRLAERLGPGRAYALFLAGAWASLFAYAVNRVPWIALVLAGLGGALVLSLTILDTTTVQTRTPPGTRGRVFGARLPMQAAGMLTGAGCVVLFAPTTAPQSLLFGATCLYLVTTAAAAISLPGSREFLRG